MVDICRIALLFASWTYSIRITEDDFICILVNLHYDIFNSCSVLYVCVCFTVSVYSVNVCNFLYIPCIFVPGSFHPKVPHFEHIIEE